MELQGKPDFEQAMRRIEAWFARDMIDRPPVRFAQHETSQPDILKRLERW